ncbi:unnamed protein product [Phytophthora lilii]|uniref:Unnamed protein product n=1 Tax=Phytophthora lilii TaxID=2077276 RepID=A0A9W6TQ09_9STRA|nr:unnamed protein product [Phytophthora lilii]
MVLWDRYGKEIGELYTSPMGTTAQGQNAGGRALAYEITQTGTIIDALCAADVKVHDVADEFSIYQKLPTFFYEYMPRRKKRDYRVS